MESYCTVRIKWCGNEANAAEDGEGDEAVAILQPNSFEGLLALLKDVRDKHADAYAEYMAAKPEPCAQDNRDMLGGVTVEVTNRWGSVAEVGLGRDVCFLARLHPEPSEIHSDRPSINGTRVFFLDGGHHTELDADLLVSREGFLQTLRRWLDEGAFPERGSV